MKISKGFTIMANRRDSQVRTPRRRKIWAVRVINETIASSPGMVDLLEPLRTDVGSAVSEGTTVMRTVGSIELIQVAQATSGQYIMFDLGFTWVGARIAALTAGDSAIPVPLNPGARDIRWLQQGTVQGLEDEVGLTSNQPLAARPPEAARWDFDFTAMGKMPVADSKYVLVYDSRTGGEETGKNGLRITVSTMLALP